MIEVLTILLLAPLTLFLMAAIIQAVAGYWLSEEKARLVSFSGLVGLALGEARVPQDQPIAYAIGTTMAFAALWWIMFRRVKLRG